MSIFVKGTYSNLAVCSIMSSLLFISALQKMQYHPVGSTFDGNTYFPYREHRGLKTLNFQRARTEPPLTSSGLGNQERDSFLKDMGTPQF